MSHVSIDTLKPKYAKSLEKLQNICFPTLAPSELLQEAHFLKHCELFPEGNFVALSDHKVVGLGSGFLTDFNFDDHHHTFMEILDGGYYTKHNPNGKFYYGADISVHPDYRGRGIGAKLYEARKAVVRHMNLRGIVAGGVIPGFVHHKHHMHVKEYVTRVVKGELHDRTLSFQLRQGFTVRGLLEDYIQDSASDNWAVLIFWENPEYHVAKTY